ncbi:MAG: hypothetical protein RR448_05890 [Niameybacter sp.]
MFDKSKEIPFCNFLEPCSHNTYKSEDSWIEELGFSKAEFRNVFTCIMKVYLASKDLFEGKLYLSCYECIKKLIYCLRNTDAVGVLLTNSDCGLGNYRDYPSSKSLKSSKDKKINKTGEQGTQSLLNFFTDHKVGVNGVPVFCGYSRRTSFSPSK